MSGRGITGGGSGYAALLAHAGGVLYGMELGSVTLKINTQNTGQVQAPHHHLQRRQGLPPRPPPPQELPGYFLVDSVPMVFQIGLSDSLSDYVSHHNLLTSAQGACLSGRQPFVRGGGRRGGVRSGPGEARTILLLHIISVRPSIHFMRFCLPLTCDLQHSAH